MTVIKKTSASIPAQDNRSVAHNLSKSGISLPAVPAFRNKPPIQSTDMFNRAGNPVQRKVGFEFQTGWQIKNAPFQLPVAMTSLTKNTALVQGDGWKLTRDAGDAEFVTDAFEEGDFAHLSKVFLELRAFTETLVEAKNSGNILTKTLNGTTMLGSTTAIQPGDASMTANPQMTAGVDMAKIKEVMKQLGDTSQPGNRQLTGARQDIMKELSQTQTGGSPEYQGLVSLIASYVHLSSGLVSYTDTPKNITSLMSRTNFGLAYAETAEAKNKSLNNAQKASQLLKDILNEVASLTPDNVLTDPPGPNMRLIPAKITDLPEKSYDLRAVAQKMRKGPTLKEWTENIIIGKDLLSGVTTVSNVSMGSKGMEPVSNIRRDNGQFTNIHRKNGIILEFRDLKKGVAQHEWGDWARALLSWVTVINDTGKKEAPLPSVGDTIDKQYGLSKEIAALNQPMANPFAVNVPFEL